MVESQALSGSLLGDPHVRTLYVYRPPSDVRRTGLAPSLYVLLGFGGQVDMWLNRRPFEPTVIECIDAEFSGAKGSTRSHCLCRPGSRQVCSTPNSVGTGRCLDYLCDEMVPFVDSRHPTISEPQPAGHHRASAERSALTVAKAKHRSG